MNKRKQQSDEGLKRKGKQPTVAKLSTPIAKANDNPKEISERDPKERKHRDRIKNKNLAEAVTERGEGGPATKKKKNKSGKTKKSASENLLLATEVGLSATADNSTSEVIREGNTVVNRDDLTSSFEGRQSEDDKSDNSGTFEIRGSYDRTGEGSESETRESRMYRGKQLSPRTDEKDLTFSNERGDREEPNEAHTGISGEKVLVQFEE